MFYFQLKFYIHTWKKEKKKPPTFSLFFRFQKYRLRILAHKECKGKKSQNIRGATCVRGNQLKLEQKEASTKSVLEKAENSC